MAGTIETFLAKARRRNLAHLLIGHLTTAACAAMVGLLVLLLLGTDILNWYWPVALFAISFAAGVWRAQRQVPTPYRLAQRIDRRLDLKDALSTAYHFRHHSAGSAVTYQQRAAEQLVAGAELSRAVPTPMPRSCYVLVGLFALAATLFAMRYLVMHSLDLRAPIADIHFGSFIDPPQRAENRKSAIQERFDEQLKQMGLSLDPVDDRPGEIGPPQGTSAFTATPDGRNPLESNEKAKGTDGKDTDRDGSGAEGEKGENSAGEESKDGSAPDALPGLNVSGKQQGQQNAQKNGAGQAGQSSSSMLDKMRDAMANLMAKLKMPNSGSPGQQQSSNNAAAPPPGQQPGQRGMQSQNRSAGEGQQNGSPTGDQAQDGSEQAQSGSSKAGDQASDRPGGQDSKSGMGKQDGDKSIEDAEQLAAMGKISEIIGKRSAQIQGEMTVEVPSGKQQLKTAYSKRRAVHGDAGGELSREEIPLMLQPYVQRYFDEIRKVPAAVRPSEQTKTRT